MPKPFTRRSKKEKTTTPEVSQEMMTLQDYLEEAEICCEHARRAGRQHRFGAARGLFETATGLYRRAIAATPTPQPTLIKQLRGIEAEMSAYSELARSMSRPFQRSG